MFRQKVLEALTLPELSIWLPKHLNSGESNGVFWVSVT